MWCVSLQEPTCQDASDSYYEYIWDSTLLEFIINLHARRGEIAKKNLAVSIKMRFHSCSRIYACAS